MKIFKVTFRDFKFPDSVRYVAAESVDSVMSTLMSHDIPLNSGLFEIRSIPVLTARQGTIPYSDDKYVPWIEELISAAASIAFLPPSWPAPPDMNARMKRLQNAVTDAEYRR